MAKRKSKHDDFIMTCEKNKKLTTKILDCLRIYIAKYC